MKEDGLITPISLLLGIKFFLKTHENILFSEPMKLTKILKAMKLSQDFIESAFTLLLTAGITGFGIPLVLRVIDDRRAQRQKEIEHKQLKAQKQYEAEITRQSKVIESQVKLLDSFAELFWEFQMIALEVSYYACQEREKLYQKAVSDYEERVGDILVKIRMEISKSIRLASSELYLRLKHIYEHELLPYDVSIGLSIRENADELQWSKINQIANNKLATIFDDALDALAIEFKLKSYQGTRFGAR